MTRDDVVNTLLTITHLKQYAYCPRVVYYETCIPDVRPRTFKMEAGKEAHERERERAARRTLAAYNIQKGERRFDVRIQSLALGLTGMIDEVVLTDAETLVVDYKLADYAGENHKLQIAAYALLAEEAFGRPVPLGYIYLLKDKRFAKVPITPELRNSVQEAIQAIDRIRLNEYMPPPTDQPNKCVGCEFRRFCNDV